jgi:hypothetical protein
MACTDAIIAKIENQQAFNGWVDGLAITNQLTNCSGVDGNSKSNVSQSSADGKMSEIGKYTSCLMQKIIGDFRDRPTQVAELQMNIQELHKNIQKEQVNVEIAKERASFLGKGGSPPSYYDSWFPIGRPIKPEAVPVFLGIIFFFLVIGLLLLLSFFGIEIQLLYPIYSSSAYGTTISSFFSRFPLSFWIVGSILVGILIYYNRK